MGPANFKVVKVYEGIEESGASDARFDNVSIHFSSNSFWTAKCYMNIGRTTFYKEL
jgi:hypothetical protein